MCNYSSYFRITKKLDNMNYTGASAAQHRLGPVEVVINVPFYVGCFVELSDPSSKGKIDLSYKSLKDKTFIIWLSG